MRVRFSARSDVGLRREINQDAYGAKELPQATLLIVCDGMGGHAAGEVASSLGVSTIIDTFADSAPPDDALRDSFIAANHAIYADGRGSMGTTGVAALFVDGHLHVANVGDSRAYLVREGQIEQISHDHSFVSDQVSAGLMTAEQARTSNVRNIITRALGYQPEVQVDTFSIPLRPGDTVLLSSDGMHGLIEDREIAEVSSMLPPDEATLRLVDTANARGGHDNITVVIAQVDEVDLPTDVAASAAQGPAAAPAAASAMAAPARERPLSRLGMLLAALTLVVLIGAAGFLLANPPSVSAPTTASPTPSAPPPTLTPTASTPTATLPSPVPTATP
ncbi:protein phosphatase 2C domain-containing protein [Oscillochloris sp. ZM17-4]|uniref:PP2C family protein-serine/threonine phosphatase n=1 Tax=Oscillochloris sp. ZM17-4 TaxID=2866714 RepID=UPI001C73C805|nr:PP2C family serine/threonine-protein phosphatase [Oscillochloris sp. ZM17-4]MBX0327699.1 protein phosphatase 2C domain-containing protein [Oscillochloris sp. ZM17-4]